MNNISLTTRSPSQQEKQRQKNNAGESSAPAITLNWVTRLVFNPSDARRRWEITRQHYDNGITPTAIDLHLDADCLNAIESGGENTVPRRMDRGTDHAKQWLNLTPALSSRRGRIIGRLTEKCRMQNEGIGRCGKCRMKNAELTWLGCLHIVRHAHGKPAFVPV